MKNFLLCLSALGIICLLPTRANAGVLDNYSNDPSKIVSSETLGDGEVIRLISQASDVKLYAVSSVQGKYTSSQVILQVGDITETFNWGRLNPNFTKPTIYELGKNKSGERLIGIKICNGSSKRFPIRNIPDESFHVVTLHNGQIIDTPIDCNSIAIRAQNMLKLTYNQFLDKIILSFASQKLILSGSDFMHSGPSIRLCPINSSPAEFTVENQKVFINFNVLITSNKRCAIEFIAKVSMQVDILDNYNIRNLRITPFVPSSENF